MRLGTLITLNGESSIHVGTVAHYHYLTLLTLDPTVEEPTETFIGSILLAKPELIKALRAVLTCWLNRIECLEGVMINSESDSLVVFPATFIPNGIHLNILRAPHKIIKRGVTLSTTEVPELVKLLWKALIEN